MAMAMPLASLEDIMVRKLLSISEEDLDFSSVLEVARPLREQIPWESVRARTRESPFANAFFTLAEELGVIEPPDGRA